MLKQRLILTAATTLLAATAALAQAPAKKTTATPVKKVTVTSTAKVPAGPKKIELKEAKPGLTAQATVKLDDALATATKNEKGTLVSERIETRGNQLLYVFGYRGKNHTKHVYVDAKSGEIVSMWKAAPKKTTMKAGDKK